MTTACMSDNHPCTGIGSLPGIRVEVDPVLAPTVGTGTLDVCWDGDCRSKRLALDGMAATFVDVAGLPDREVEVTLLLENPSGAPVVDQTLAVTPEVTYPNGPDCGEGGAQAGVVVGADGTVRAR